jgi:methylated-DNA-[protein]-cysteine S-methyltransferase
MSEHYISYFKPPFGLLLLESTEDVLLRVQWVKNQDIPETETRPILDETKKQLQEYFDGKRETFDLSFNARGTAFQKKVWKVLRQIPYGEIKSYKDIAEAINNPTAPRVVLGTVSVTAAAGVCAFTACRPLPPQALPAVSSEKQHLQ